MSILSNISRGKLYVYDMTEMDPFTSNLAELLQADSEQLRIAEAAVPVLVEQDVSLRPKVIDACSLTCNFCHNEGTPVAIDHRDGVPVRFTGTAGPSGRVSVFSEYNGVDFLPGRMEPDERFAESLTILRDTLGLEDLHLTGGEPSLHPKLVGIIALATDLGYNVGMTSNGESGGKNICAYADAGLQN